MTVAWVVGAGGMLGSALCLSLARTGTALFVLPERIVWEREDQASRQLGAAVCGFADWVAAAEADWEIYWAAGLGTMGSPASSLASETRLLGRLLATVSSIPVLAQRRGSLLLASSAGAIYAGSSDEVITEATTIAPTTDYAREKLEQERRCAEFVSARPNTRAVIARLSTLYGPQPRVDKRQGLIAEMARRIVRNQSVNIFVPLDTIRDYLAVDDAAEAIVAVVREDCGESGAYVKIFASGQATTISEITAIFKKVAHRKALIITSASTLSPLYRRRIQFRSLHPVPGASRPPTSLAVGIARVMAAERLAHARTRIESPEPVG